MTGARRRPLAASAGCVAGILVALIAVTGLLPAAPARAATTRAVAATVADDPAVSVTIDAISPAALRPGTKLVVRGQVLNDTDLIHLDAQVYLSVSSEPAVTRAGLEDFQVGSGEEFGNRVLAFGRFDMLGAIRPGDAKAYRLAIPFGKLPISEASGSYHVGVVVVSSTPGEERATAATADTLVPYLSEDTAPDLRPTRVITMLPVTARVSRQPNGTFTDDSLAVDLAVGGRLRNLMDFAVQAPADSLHLVVDPALQSAVQAMSKGYTVQSFSELDEAVTPRRGRAQAQATQWLADLSSVEDRQNITLMPWGDPATSALADATLPGVVGAGVRASRRYASEEQYSTAVVDWQSNGLTSRRGLTIARLSGAASHVVSERILPALEPTADGGYAPPWVAVPTQTGPLSTVVTRADVAGAPFRTDLTPLELRQLMLAESVVRSLSSQRSTTMVIAAPVQWDPGSTASRTNMSVGYAFPTIRPIAIADLVQRIPRAYDGPVRLPLGHPELTSDLVDAIRTLRDTGRALTELLTDGSQATVAFDQRLALTGSSAWLWRPQLGEKLARRTAEQLQAQVAEVTVTGPAFVALSSSSGSFPLTVSNGLDVPVTVQLKVTPQNPALGIQDIDPIPLDAGQTRDIRVKTSSEGSGLTSVRARLTTVTDRPFGDPWVFDIRATQIGVAIWVVMGVLVAGLFSAVAVRIWRRVRAHGFTPRGNTPA